MRVRSALLTLSFLLALPLGAATLEQDVQRYIAIFSGDLARHNDAVETLAWQGISDPRLFDLLEQRVLAEHESAREDGQAKPRVARYIRALGFSGQRKYEPTILRMVADEGYSKYGRQALEDLGTYGAWNRIISDRSTFTAGLDDEDNRVINMLRADDLQLKRIGAKRVYFGGRSDAVLEIAAEQAYQLHARTAGMQDGDSIDSIAWLVKAVASSDREAFRPLLTEIAGGVAHKKVKKWAVSGLERLNKRTD